jgi:hypothetical protein
MGFLTSFSIDEIRSRGSIRDSDVLRLRRALEQDHAISAEEADALIALNAECPVKDPSWGDVFVDIVAEYLVHMCKPEGYVSADKTIWLMERIGKSGRIQGHNELELLLAVVEKARWSPPSIAAFALRQIEHSVLAGAGPLRPGLAPEPGAISEVEVSLARRVMLAFGVECSLPLTRAEAEVLMGINEAVHPQKSSPAWTELFVSAVGNAVLASLGHAVPVRADALRREAWHDHGDARSVAALLRDGTASVASQQARDRLSALSGRGPREGGVWANCRTLSPEERALSRLERQRLEIITNEPIEEADEAWLLGRLQSKARLNDNEAALLTFIEREASVLPDSIRTLAAKARVAA